MAPKAAPVENGGNGDGGQDGGGGFQRFMMQMMMMMFVMNIFSSRQKSQQQQQDSASGTAGGQLDMADGVGPPVSTGKGGQLHNMYGALEECDLWVHWSLNKSAPPLHALINATAAAEEGFELLWHERVWYEQSPTEISKNVSVGPFSPEVLAGATMPYVHATLLRAMLLKEGIEEIPKEQVISQSLALVAMLRELNPDAQAENLFAAEEELAKPAVNVSAARLPYLKTKIDVRPVFDQTVHTMSSIKQGPFRHIRVFPELGAYQPILYLSDFWLLEKDYLPLNETLKDARLNLTLAYSGASLWVWSIQAQMQEQWMTQSEWGLTDTQRDSFMVKRLVTDTNPYFLAFSGCFVLLHTLFSMLAFKNDIQFWRKNESMQGLSARSMIVSFVCQMITALYLLDSREASRLIIFEILLDLALAFWKLRKAIKLELKPQFPFLAFQGQTGYENAGTSKYDEEAIHYMFALLTPAFIGYVIRSAVYGKHRGWYSFLVGAAAGGVYTFGFVMMTPQLYINYKLQSVEHLPWRAMTYKAFNTFIDDVAAFLIDMPIMHRLSCFRDDIVFFIYLYQRWKYRVDKTRPSMWVDGSEEAPQGAVADKQGASAEVEGEAAAAAGSEPAAEAAAGGREPAKSEGEVPAKGEGEGEGEGAPRGSGSDAKAE